MKVSGQGSRRRRILVPLVSAILALGLLVGLGTWQLQRLAWKEGLIASLTQRLAAPPMPLPAAEGWANLDPETYEFRRVSVRIRFPEPDQVLVYTPGSALRPDVKGAGHWVMALGETEGGGRILVNRGFLPRAADGGPQPAPPPPAGPVELTGVLRWPEPRGWFTPEDDPARNRWFTRDPAAIAAAKGWGTLAPFYIEQEMPQAPGGRPKAGSVQASLPNNHLQYALTWYFLAATLAIVSIVYFIRMRREADDSDDSA